MDSQTKGVLDFEPSKVVVNPTESVIAIYGNRGILGKPYHC